MKHPIIIQGGMGVGVSNWRLANAVARTGQLGVVSGTGLNTVLIRRLQDGDQNGMVRQALKHFPIPSITEAILNRYFIEGGKSSQAAYKRSPMYTINPNPALVELTIAANFAEVWLAKQGHNGAVGINLLEKIQLPNLASLYGAMLAGVDYVLMGAGIPREIPEALDRLSEHQNASLRLHVDDETTQHRVVFEPQRWIPQPSVALKRPYFLPIVASTTLALSLARKTSSHIDGLIIEGPTAGGHNAPPRGAAQLNSQGEPVYGIRDEVDLEKIKGLGLPFWLAGSYADPNKLNDALKQGATGIQVGSIFALCDESGITANLKHQALQAIIDQTLVIRTDPAASPTGFPFKVAQLQGTIAEPSRYASRPRQCDLGYLRTAVERPDGTLAYRCPAEPIDAYVHKGGQVEDTHNRKCLCNGLMATVGIPQIQSQYVEEPLLTLGDDVASLLRLLPDGATAYSASSVVDYLTSRLHQQP